MAIEVLTQSLNIGVVDEGNLHRTDLERMRLTAEIQTNLVPKATGPAQFRPGTKYLGATKSSAECLLQPFIAGEDDGFLLELTTLVLRVRDPSDDALVTRPAVTSVVTNGDFSSAVGWTLAATLGQSSAIGSGVLTLAARAHGGLASCKRQCTTVETGVEHALRIDVDRGPVMFRVGSSDGGQQYIEETELKTGTHSLAFTPSGDFWVQFTTTSQVNRIVNSITVEAAGVMELPTIWPLAALPELRVVQSLDVMFCVCAGYKQQRIERRGDTSWSVVDYDSDDGPFRTANQTDVTLLPAATEGNTTLTASRPYFTAEMVGQLFQIYHEGQKIETFLAGPNQFTPAFLVSGVTETNVVDRQWTQATTGTWVGTLRNQRSFDGEDVEFHDYRRAQTVATIDITVNAAYTNDDNEDNALVYYRIGFPTGLYTSGEAAIAFDYNGGGGVGICRVVGFTSSTVVDIEILKPFKGKHASTDWQAGEWSAENGYPAAVALADGRLWMFGNDKEWGSISDAYESFDETFVGDAGPINRSIARGGRNKARWAVGAGNLLVGCDARLINVTASALDEIITPDNLNNKSLGKIGSAKVAPAECADDRVLFVEAAGTAIYEANYDSAKGKVLATEFSKLTNDIFATGIRQMVVQNRPDQRILVANEGAAATTIIFEPQQQVVAHIPWSTEDAGAITDYVESIAVLPGVGQDRVYRSIKRVVNGSTVRFIEKDALDSEAKPATICKVVDSHVTFAAAATTVSLPHLIGRTVVGWMDGAPICDTGTTDQTEFVVPGSGIVTLPTTCVTGGVMGLPYRWRYKSPRLSYGAANTTPMLKNKGLAKVGLMMSDYCRSGVQYGTEFDNASHPLFDLPALKNGTDGTEVVSGPDGDEELHSVSGKIGLDERLCLEGRSPKPATVLAIVMAVENYA